MAVMYDAPATTAYAGFWIRFGAWVIDAIALGVVSGILSGVLKGFGSLLSALIFLAYFTYFESSERQASPGKMVFGLKVTSLNGDRLSWQNALGRTAGKFVSSAILGIGYLMVAFTERKQGLHDMMANTLVLRTK